jgi:hypothetical protein
MVRLMSNSNSFFIIIHTYDGGKFFLYVFFIMLVRR